MTTHDIAAARRTSTHGQSSLLRTALKLDATVSAANAAAYLAAATVLDDLLGLPVDALREVGAFLVVFAAVVWYVGTRPGISRPAAWGVVVANAVWVVVSVVEAVAGWGLPTAVGTGWILLQAVSVVGVATLEWAGLKRSSTAWRADQPACFSGLSP